MSITMVKVRKSYKGERWENTYCLVNQGSGASDPVPGLTQEDLNLYLGTVDESDALDAASTLPTGAEYRGGGSILAAIVGFERLLHSSAVQFDEVFLTDGQKDTQQFRTIKLGYPGLKNWQPEFMAPGSVVMQVTRSARGIGARAGRLQYRACMLDEWITFDGFRLVGLMDQTATTAVIQTLFGTTAGNSLLGSWVKNEESGVFLAIPVYSRWSPGPPASGGELKSYHVWDGIGGVEARSRQVPKGRKRK